MRQMSYRIRRADLEIEKLRVAIINQFPAPSLIWYDHLPAEEQELVERFKACIKEMGGVDAAMESTVFTPAEFKEIKRILRDLKLVPSSTPPPPSPPHPLIRNDQNQKVGK